MPNNIKELKVKFVKFKGEIVALFPELEQGENEYITCYAHLGQHSTASKSLLRCKKALPSEYFSLYKELLGIYTSQKFKEDDIFILKVM